MLTFTKFQEKNYGVHARYERVVISEELKLACNVLKSYAVNNKLEFRVRPMYHDDYAQWVADHPQHFNCHSPIEHLEGWFNEPKYKRAISLPTRELIAADFPDEMVSTALDALKQQETVYENAAVFRMIKLEPGDMMILHYDPKTFYKLGKEWPTIHDGKYIDKRAFVYMNDRQPGQVSWLGANEIDYKKHSMFTFDATKVYHGSANFGYDDRYMISFGWAEPV